VRARQIRHAFPFGTCVRADKLWSPQDEKYRQILTELFNYATLENELKWEALAGDWGPGFTLDAARMAIAWLRERGVSVRGHTLVWPGWRNLPRQLRAHEKDPPALRAAIERHVREVASAVQGTVSDWDVVNEPFDNHDVIDILGERAMVDWFEIARATDPAPRLYINDHGILPGGGGDTPHRAHYERTIRSLIDQRAPLDGIGLQGHFGDRLTVPEDLLAILDRFAGLGRPIMVTEYDVAVDDEELAGQFTRDLVTAVFSHPAAVGFVMWGFWDGAHWMNNAPLYRRDWSLKPAGAAFRELVLKRWRTEEAATTGLDGAVVTRAFLGDYAIEVRAGAAQKLARARLAAPGATVTVALD
jgi:GH35 family endo-1,4-beta-xylanase